MRLWMVCVLAGATAALPGRASAVKSREVTTFVYPQSPTNTYRLPQYRVPRNKIPGLSRCGQAQAEGLQFEPDGQTFHLDPPPDRLNPGGVRRTVRVQRGKSSCFDAEIRIVVALLEEPDPASWTVEWSPDRPDAVDILVPSTRLANDTAMQEAHRITFPWSGRALEGSWVECASTCKWRVPVDDAIRREFLTRAEVPVRIEAKPLRGLGSSAGVFNPQDGSKRKPPKTVKLPKWQIKPDISRRVPITADQTEVSLTFPGAWAIKPTTGDGGPQIVHTPSGPVLKFGAARSLKPFDLTPGGGQLKAYLKLELSDNRRKFLVYVGRYGSTTAELPPGTRVCAPGPVSRVQVGTLPASTIPLNFIEAGDQCGRPRGKLAATIGAPVIRAADIRSVALDWSPSAPNRLDVYVRSEALVRSSAIREDTELVVADHAPGKWVGCFAKYCQYRIEDFAEASQLVAPTITLRSKRMQAERTPPLDAVTGLPYEPQQVESGAWRVPDAEIIVGVPFLDGDTRATGTINSPVGRFFQPGPVSCGADTTCTIDPNEGASMAVRVEGAGPLQIRTVRVPTVPLAGVSLIQIRGEVWRPTSARLRLKMSTCRYDIRQLSRAIAGVNEASILFQARLRPGSSEYCPGQDWSVTMGTGERGHAQLQRGLLEVYLEAVPKPGEAGSGDVPIAFEYPSGQKVKIESGAMLSVEPAPQLGPPRVSVRLPGGDLRPLGTHLAVNRPNILYFDMLQNPIDWGVEVVRARSLFRSCRSSDEVYDEDEETFSTAPDFSDEASYGSYCIIPNETTNESLKLRFVRQGETQRLLRTGVDPAILPPEEQKRFRRGGWIEVDTGRPAQPWSIAMDLESRTELVCGTRVISMTAGTTPRAVNYDDFNTNCEVRITLGAPARSGPPDRTPLEDTIAFFGDQKIEVRGRSITGDDNSGTTVLSSVRLRAETKDQEVLVIPVSLAEIGNNPPEDYAVVEVEIAHAQGFYASDEKWSQPNSVSRIRVRRGPEYMAWWSDSGRGIRIFGAFTATPFSLFRFPHSGKGITTSEAAGRLEAATVALGVVGILEAWNFDYNEAIIPVINPQIQIGALISSNPTQDDLSLPGVSLIAGIGLRSGVGTNPGDTLETSLKTVVWYEMLWQEDGRGNNPSHNLLFGFTVDLGSTPN